MRFATRVDRWVLWVFVVTVVVTGIMFPALVLSTAEASMASRLLSLAPLLVWLVVLPFALPQYYELREEGLLIRRGCCRSLLAYESLTEVRSVVSSLSAPVFSRHRVTLDTRDTRENRQLVIAVAEEERFLDELGRRTPQLEHAAFGLTLSVSAREQERARRLEGVSGSERC